MRLCSEKVRSIDGESRSPLLKLASPAAPGASRRSATSRSDSGYGSGRSTTLLITLNTAVFAPIPMASVSNTVTAKPGAFANRRIVSFQSASNCFDAAPLPRLAAALRHLRHVAKLAPRAPRRLFPRQPFLDNSSVRSSMCSSIETARSL